MALMRQSDGGFNADSPATAEEARRVIEADRRILPAALATNVGLLNTLIEIDQFDRPDDYYETLGDTYAGFDAAALAGAAASELRESDMVFVIVGDASVVRPQLESLGLEIETLEASDL